MDFAVKVAFMDCSASAARPCCFGFMDLLLRLHGLRGQGRLHGLFCVGFVDSSAIWSVDASPSWLELYASFQELVASAASHCCFGFVETVLHRKRTSCIWQEEKQKRASVTIVQHRIVHMAVHLYTWTSGLYVRDTFLCFLGLAFARRITVHFSSCVEL